MTSYPQHKCRISIIGTHAAGKSSICRKLLDIPLKTLTGTVGMDLFFYHKEDLTVEIIDTGGHPCFNKLNMDISKMSDAIIFVYDASYPESLREIENIVHNWNNKLPEKMKIACIIGNKADVLNELPSNNDTLFGLPHYITSIYTTPKTNPRVVDIKYIVDRMILRIRNANRIHQKSYKQLKIKNKFSFKLLGK